MGYYLGSDPRRGLTANGSPTITAAEYLAALSGVLPAVLGEPRSRCGRCRRGLRYLAEGLPGAASRVFAEHVQCAPADEHTYRLLGLAHLAWGNLRAAAHALDIALGLVRRNLTRAIGLEERLRLQCEAALLRLVLVRVRLQLGERQAALWLVREGHAV